MGHFLAENHRLVAEARVIVSVGFDLEAVFTQCENHGGAVTLGAFPRNYGIGKQLLTVVAVAAEEQNASIAVFGVLQLHVVPG